MRLLTMILDPNFLVIMISSYIVVEAYLTSNLGCSFSKAWSNFWDVTTLGQKSTCYDVVLAYPNAIYKICNSTF